MRDFGRTIEIDRGDFNALYKRGFSHLLLGRYAEAIADQSASLDIEPRYANALFARGVARTAYGELEEAVEDFDMLIALNPDSGQAYHGRGSAYLRMEKPRGGPSRTSGGPLPLTPYNVALAAAERERR